MNGSDLIKFVLRTGFFIMVAFVGLVSFLLGLILGLLTAITVSPVVGAVAMIAGGLGGGVLLVLSTFRLLDTFYQAGF